jgi:radical SAM-linked protein
MSNVTHYYAIVKYSKSGLLRYLGHLDIARAFDRAVRRARIGVKYSEGFSPRARITFAPPLPVGAEGTQELCAIELVEPESAEQLFGALSPQLAGFTPAEVRVKRGTKRSPFAELQVACYDVIPDFADNLKPEQLHRAVVELMARQEIVIERSTKRRTTMIDVRPYIYELHATGNIVSMCLGMTQETLVKPDEVLTELAKILGTDSAGWRRLTRTGLYAEIPPQEA